MNQPPNSPQAKSPLRRTIEIIAGLAFVTATVVWLSGGFVSRVPPGSVTVPTAARPASAVEAVVERAVGPVAEWASGAVASARRTIVSSRVLARIRELRVRAGDTVAEGDVLVVLESQDLQARVAQARDALKAARARRDLAREEKTRYETLFKRGVATQRRYDEVRAALTAAQAEASNSEQRLREAETMLSYTTITAPVAGRVIDRLAEPGETAAPGRPLLRIYDPAALRVESPVRETLAVRLRVGQKLRVTIPALSETLEGRIAEIVPFAEPGARTLLVKTRLPRTTRLFAGMFARVAVPAGQRARLLAPVAAIERIGQLEFATVAAANGRLERRLVTTGDYRRDGFLEVLSGLAEGERVVLTPES